jgi:PAS domain S-box-containing protein
MTSRSQPKHPAGSRVIRQAGKAAATNGRRAEWGFLLVFAFLAAGIVTVVSLYYRNYERQFRAQAERQLAAIAELKVNQLVQYRKERLGDANTFYNNPAFAGLVRRFLEGPADADAQQQLQAWFGKFQSYYEYSRIYLLDVQGAKRVAVPDEPEPLPGHLAKDKAAVLQSGQVTFLDFHRDAPGLPVHLEILVPIFDRSDTNRPLGVLVLRINPNVWLSPYLRQWPVPSETAETLLVRREGNEAVFLNELRFQTNTPLGLRTSLENTNIPAVRAVLGQEGIMEGTDYRGVPVLAALNAVPDSPWFLVAKIDRTEVYAPLRERLRLTLLLAGLLLISAGLGIGTIWRHQRVQFYREKYEVEAERAKLSAIVESSEDAIIGKSLDGTITSWNAGAERIYGYSAAEAIGKPITILIPPGQPDELPQFIGKIRRGEAVEHYETERLRKTGERLQISLTLSPVKDAAGVIVGISAIGHDITERKRTEETLRASEIRYRRLFEAARDGILILDAGTGIIAEVNPFLIKMLGYSHEVFLGKKVWELGFFKDIVANQNKFAELQQKEYVRYEGLPLETGDGRRIEVEFVSNVYLVNRQKVIQCNIRDITERKRAEEKIKRTLADLEHSNKELEQFAYVASHDLQEPLRMVSSYTQLLAQRYEGQLDDKAKKYIHYAVDGAIRMQTLINDLLAYSRVGTRGQPLAPTDSHAALGEAMRNLATLVEETRAIITNDDLPTVRADASQFNLVFQNLLSNAIKFRGQDLPRIHVSALDRDGEWVFAVRDNGIGIEPQHAERVFVLFQRLHTQAEHPGTGIGLAVCKRIVERHGGRIWFESEPGKGSTFFFTVPK